MPRRSYKKTQIKPDYIYSSLEVSKLIHYIMVDGKKTIAQKLVYKAFDELKKQGKDPLKIFHQAIINVSPRKEVRPRRLGGASYLVPVDVRRERKLFLALSWIVQAAKKRPNKQYKTFDAKLLSELLDAADNKGEAVNKKVQIEKLAKANKAFAHLRW